jgi:glucose/arabinose dehydrogenase
VTRPLQLIAAIALALFFFGSTVADAASLQPIGTFEQPTYVTSDPGNPNRLFVVERKGKIKQVQNGVTTVFADLSAQVGCAAECAGERGLLSIAMAPDFDSSGRFFVDYANNDDGMLHVAELRAGGESAPISSLRGVLEIPHSGATNHNGGQLQFGPEGELFVSTGDGGGGNDEFHHAQDLKSPLGKILRIDPQPSALLPYTVPAGNPFAAVAGDYAPIWSYGLRNPFRFSFDRLSGALTIADVGQGAREEVDFAPAPALGAGANYGWNCREGLAAGPADDPGCAGSEPSDFVDPVFDYSHEGGRCAIIGGYTVRDRSLGDLYGRYLYGDLCAGELRSLDLTDPFPSDRGEGLQIGNLNSFGEDSCGRVYAVSGNGGVWRLVEATPNPCVTTQLRPALVGIRAASRKIRRGRRALITAWVAPCQGRRGEPVSLIRGHHRIGTRHLDRVCSVRFRPRIGRRANFRAKIKADSAYLAASSRRLKVRPRRAPARSR